MASRPSITPAFGLPRSILLPASFAGCGMVLAMLLLLLNSCAAVLGIEDVSYATPNERNAILCECTCDGIVDPTASTPHTITLGDDDVSQAAGRQTVARTFPELLLGQGGYVGLRFRTVGVPKGATITSANIQFTSVAAQPESDTTDLIIRAVNSPNADPFTDATDLTALTPIAELPWVVALPWNGGNEKGEPEKTPNLKDLVQAIVSLDNYTHDSAIAFVITGSGKRTARAVEGLQKGGSAAALTVTYTPKKAAQDFLACADPADANDPTRAAAVCQGVVQSNVSDLAKTCRLASACTCTLKTADAVSFSKVCNDPCPAVVAPQNCDPAGIAQTTQATAGHTPVCVATSPLGSVLFGQRSACDIDPSRSNVHARIFKGDDSSSSDSAPRGRIEFVGAPCPGDSCSVGMTHRMNVGDMTFPSHNLLASDAVVNQLTGVGESTVNAFVLDDGTGSFSTGLTNHAMRGNEVGGDTIAVVRANDEPLAISIGVDPTRPGGWRAGGICTMKGTMFQAGNQNDGGIEMFVDIKGTLVNQPPTADAGPDRTVECNAIGRGIFTLEGSAQDPDNNVAWFGWFRGSRTGQLVGMLPSVELEQAVSTTTSYVFKVLDTFGQYDEDTTSVGVVDTTPPSVTAPANAQAECTGPAGTPVDIGQATATDVCDASPDISSDTPQLFKLGTTTVTWSATDDSKNVGHATQQVNIVDTTPPDLTVQLSPTVLWPPAHKLVAITATITVTDKCDPNPTIRLVSITSNEPDNGLGDGDQPNDIQATFGTDDRTFLLRSERGGRGSGRVYTVTYEASDASGNKTTRQATVTVPKSQ